MIIKEKKIPYDEMSIRDSRGGIAQQAPYIFRILICMQQKSKKEYNVFIHLGYGDAI
ncbi:MAG: hypothetical protein HY069_02555 [Chlamydiia bacterium]|nr:hypothetical protein [Chlamydiia bacterium]